MVLAAGVVGRSGRGGRSEAVEAAVDAAAVGVTVICLAVGVVS